MNHEELNNSLAKLGLHYLKSNLNDFIASAVKQRWSSQQSIEKMVQYELQDHSRRNVERRITSAKLGKFKSLSEFDWSWPRKIDRDCIETLMKGDFVKEQSNVILFGPSGCGKTMIAKNLAYATVMNGTSALCTDAFEMLTELEQQESSRTLRLKLSKYIKPKLLVIDELGYLSYTTKSADLLFRVITGRYQTGSTILTTNVPFKDWATIFPEASCLSALVDRLMHKADVTTIEADSFRQKEASERKASQKTKSNKNEVKRK
ncbi:MAG: IS21-like element helper ATPase IstB [Proteobacteria bacterium]|nr:IS21-like element helper ATPase IstB [Pseudomonadota bacterium]